MSSRDLRAVVKTQKAFIKELLDRLEGKLIYNNENDELYFKVQDDEYSFCEILAFLNDDYFKGLSLPQICELAKKSIRLTKDNCDLRHEIEKLLERAKLNGDNFYANELKEILNPPEF